jgi:protein-tyrosine phosphatase
MFSKILVVCTGNICRSPLGEGLLRQRLRRRSVEVRSAGTGAMVGWPADPLSVEVAQAHGLDLSAHRAQQATQALLTGSDLILTLDQTHSAWLNRNFPELRGRVHKLLKWRENRDVADPYRLPLEAFEQAWNDIELGVEDWLQKIA